MSGLITPHGGKLVDRIADDNRRKELEADIREKKLRLAMAKEFDRLKQAAQIDNFVAGMMQKPPFRPEAPQPIWPASSTRTSHPWSRAR